MFAYCERTLCVLRTIYPLLNTAYQRGWFTLIYATCFSSTNTMNDTSTGKFLMFGCTMQLVKVNEKGQHGHELSGWLGTDCYTLIKHVAWLLSGSALSEGFNVHILSQLLKHIFEFFLICRFYLILYIDMYLATISSL